MTNKVIKTTMNRLKGAAVAAGLGLTALLTGCATTGIEGGRGQSFGGFAGVGYKTEAQKATYDEVIKRVSTPAEAIDYRDHCLPYAKDREVYGDAAKNKFIGKDGKEHDGHDYWAPFKQIHANGRDDCDGVSFAMAALLSDNGYKPQILFLTKPVSGVEKMFARQSGDKERADQTEDDYHTVYPYQDPKTGKWGCIGVGRIEDRDPKYDTLEAMVKSLKIGWQYYGYEIDTKAYDKGLLDLDKQYGRENWVAGDMNLKGATKTSIAVAKYNAMSPAEKRAIAAQTPATTYITDAFNYMSSGVHKNISKEELISQFHNETGYSRELAERHYSMAIASKQLSQKEEIAKKTAAKVGDRVAVNNQ